MPASKGVKNSSASRDPLKGVITTNEKVVELLKNKLMETEDRLRKRRDDLEHYRKANSDALNSDELLHKMGERDLEIINFQN